MALHTGRDVVREGPGPERGRRRAVAALLVPLAAAWLAATASAATPSPEARHGEALYVGSARLSAGGAPCLGCHGVAGHGLARAASFGPDLTGAYAQYGAEGLDGLLEDVVFPSMAPLYRDHAVTKEERAALVAFLAQAPAAQPADEGRRETALFAGGVAAAAAGFLGLVLVIGRRGGARGRAAAAGRTP